jgi:hypothetical protein
MTINEKTNDNTDSSKETNSTTNQKAGGNAKAHEEKRTAATEGSPAKKGTLPEILTTQGWIRQDKDKCAAGASCKAVMDMPLTTHHRCAICAFCLHGDCGVELKETEKNKVPTSHKAICFACIDRIQAGRLLKLDKISGTQFILLGRYKVYKLIRKKYPLIKLIDPVPLDDSESSKYSSNNPYCFKIKSTKKSPPKTYPSTTKPTPDPKTATNTTTKKQTQPNDTQQTANSVQEGPKDIEIDDIDDDVSQDDATVDAGNSRSTPHSSTPMNASTTISKKYMDVQIKLEKIKSTKPIDAINACRDRCKSWLKEIQQIETSFKLHPVDPDNQNQTILHAIKDFPQDLNDLRTFFKNAKPIMKGGMLYLKILASFDGEPDQLLSKVLWYHKERKERIAVSYIQASKVALLGWLCFSLRAMDTALLTETIGKLIKRPISLRWMRISDGSAWDPDRDTSKDPRAIHVKTALANREEVKQCLHCLYGSTSKKFPL